MKPPATASSSRPRKAPPPPKRFGRGKKSYLLFDQLLSPAQQLTLRRFVAAKDVQSQLYGVGTMASDSLSDRNSRIALLGRPNSFPEPTIPSWLDRKLRVACKKAHSIYGNQLCPLGIDSSGRSTPRYEPCQYAEYREGGHYSAWHTDADEDESDITDLRCVTIVLMVSDSDAYEGGALEVSSHDIPSTEAASATSGRAASSRCGSARVESRLECGCGRATRSPFRPSICGTEWPRRREGCGRPLCFGRGGRVWSRSAKSDGDSA